MPDLRRLPILVALLGGWAIATPYADSVIGLEVDVRPAVEVVDHVIPGIAVVLAGVALAASPRALLSSGLVVGLAGVWMTATHVPLLADAGDPGTSVGAAAWMTAPGLAVLLVGGAVVVRALTLDESASGQDAAPRQ